MLVIVCHIRRNAGNYRFVVVGAGVFNFMSDNATMAAQVIADNRRCRPGHVKGIASQTTKNLCDKLLTRAHHIKPIISLSAVHRQGLNVNEIYIQTCAINAILGYNEIVAELGADNDNGVQPVAAVNVHRRVHGVLNQVNTGAAGDIRSFTDRLL